MAEKDNFDLLIVFHTSGRHAWSYRHFVSLITKKWWLVTTGFYDAGKAAIQAASEKIAIVFASNFSVGVNLVFKLLEKAAKVMGRLLRYRNHWTHTNRHKVDAPSGTALSMGEHIAKTLGRDLKTHGVFCREGITGERKRDEIGFSTIRASDVVGEHSVWLQISVSALKLLTKHQAVWPLQMVQFVPVMVRKTISRIVWYDRCVGFEVIYNSNF